MVRLGRDSVLGTQKTPGKDKLGEENSGTAHEACRYGRMLRSCELRAGTWGSQTVPNESKQIET